jgi:hypothetical protein
MNMQQSPAARYQSFATPHAIKSYCRVASPFVITCRHFA